MHFLDVLGGKTNVKWSNDKFLGEQELETWFLLIMLSHNSVKRVRLIAELRFISRHANARQRKLRCLEEQGTLLKNFHVKLIDAVPCMNTTSNCSHIQTSGGNVTILNIEIESEISIESSRHRFLIWHLFQSNQI